MAKTEGKPELARREPDAMEEGAFGAVPTRAVPMSMNKIDVPYMTAMRVPVPRDITKISRDAEREATLAGAGFIYSWTVGGQAVEGVSIEGAMILARAWGNCTCPVEIVEETPTHWTFRAVFVDLESGFTLPRLFRQRKEGVVGGKYDADRKLDMTFQIGQSKAVRNVIVRALPIWLVEKCMNASRAGAEKELANVPAEAERAIAGYAKLGVTEAMLAKRLGAPRDAWLPRDLVTLRAVHKALQERTTTIEEEFGVARAEKDEKPEEKPSEPEKPRQREPGED